MPAAEHFPAEVAVFEAQPEPAEPAGAVPTALRARFAPLPFLPEQTAPRAILRKPERSGRQAD